MPSPVQAGTVLSVKPAGIKRLPKTIKVVFRSETGAVGKRDHLTHWIHSYPAKMFHRIPQVILSRLPQEPKLRILDPFCGSGTVLLEAIARGHEAFGIDVNPMARLISEVKTNSLDTKHLSSHLSGILTRSRVTEPVTDDETLGYWFKPDIRQNLEALARSISEVRHGDCRRFYQVCFSSIVRKASLADPTIPPPVKMSESRAQIANARYKKNFEYASGLTGEDVYALFEAAVSRNLQRMDKLVAIRTSGKAKILPPERQAAKTGLRRESIDLVITSPPYCGAQKYIRSVRLELLLLGFTHDQLAEADRRTLGTERLSAVPSSKPFVGSPLSVRLYNQISRKNTTRANIFVAYVRYLDSFAEELFRILKLGGEAFVTFGTDRVAGTEIDCAKLFAQAAVKHGLAHVCTLVDSIPSRGMITNRHNSASTIKDERVVWLRK